MVRRSRIVIKILSGLLASLALLVLVLAWRLSNGPISLERLTPFLKNALSQQTIDANIDFKDAVLTWRSAADNPTGNSSLEVRFVDLVLRDEEVGLQIEVPMAGMQFSGLGLLRGFLAPTFAEFYGLRLDITLPEEIWHSQSDEPFISRLRAFLEDFQNSERLVPRLTRQLLSPPGPMKATGYMEQFILRNTVITATDELSGESWTIPDGLLNIKRTEVGILVLLEGEIAVQSERIMPIHLTVAYNNKRKEAVSEIRLSQFRPDILAGKIEGLKALAPFEIPMSGIIDFVLDESLDIETVGFEFDVGQGVINPSNIYQVPVPITQASLRGTFQQSEKTIFLDDFRVQLDDTLIQGDGKLYQSYEKPGISIEATVEKLSFKQLSTYWPGAFAKGAHRWISRYISAGHIPSGKMRVELKPEMWEMEKLPHKLLNFTFDVRNISAQYLRGMPLLREADGQGILDLENFDLLIDHGKVMDVDVRKARMLFKNINIKGGATAYMDIPISGDVAEILKIIDHKPLGYPTKYGIKEGHVDGIAKALLKLQFPLIRGLKLKDLIFSVKADIKNLNIPELSQTLSISDGTIGLLVDAKGIQAKGDIVLNNVRFDAEWSEEFKGSGKYPTRYAIRGDLQGRDWGSFSLPFEPYITGPAEMSLSLYGRGASLKKGHGTFDFTRAEIAFAPLDWKKAIAVPAQADFALTFKEKGAFDVPELHMAAGDLEFDGGISLTEDRVTKFQVNHFEMKNTQAQGIIVWDGEKERYRIAFEGKKFDGGPILETILFSDKEGKGLELPDFELTADFEKIRGQNDIWLDDSGIRVIFENKTLREMNFKGTWQGDKWLSVIVEPNEENRTLKLSSNDAGQALRAVGIFKIGDQGEIKLEADMLEKEKGIFLKGTVEVKKLTIAESPEFLKLLEEKKFEKARLELEKNGLKFDSFKMNFEQYDGIMTVKNGRARGDTLGVTLQGTVDQAYDELKLSGTIVPAYGLNSLLGNIPLVGTILTGGKGEGVFSATFTMTGPFDKPKISVNPLAVLAPGILRKIFGVVGADRKKTLRQEAEELEGIVPDVQKKK